MATADDKVHKHFYMHFFDSCSALIKYFSSRDNNGLLFSWTRYIFQLKVHLIFYIVLK